MNIIKLISLLPQIKELKSISSDNTEAFYIFKQTLELLHKYATTVPENFSWTDACSKCLCLMESLVEKTWEMINIGHFSQVSINIRKTYTVANYFKIMLLLIRYPDDKHVTDKSIEYLDKAILIGCSDNLYPQNNEFQQNLNEFLNPIDIHTESSLLCIEKLKYENVACDIPKLDCPSIEHFQNNYFMKRPIILKNIINHWPALTKWRDLNYIMKVAGTRSVPIEIGSNYTGENWSQEFVKIKDFLNRNFNNENIEELPAEHVEYLAQHELFDQIPKLKDDIRIPEYCLCNIDDTEIDIKAWLGPAGTVSPMHYDPKNNIFCQVFGQKKIILACPESLVNLYPYNSNFLNNTSAVDVESIDYVKYPLVKNVQFLQLILQEGECLYIPPKWWHFVKSLHKSFSVSFWWE